MKNLHWLVQNVRYRFLQCSKPAPKNIHKSFIHTHCTKHVPFSDFFFQISNVASKIGKYLMKYFFLFFIFPIYANFHTKNMASSITPC
jgi:hypothetical protein